MYYVLASQSGQIIKAQKAGIGEYVKDGEMIAEIVPDKIQFAVELFVEPFDLPLIATGQKFVSCLTASRPLYSVAGQKLLLVHLAV